MGNDVSLDFQIPELQMSTHCRFCGPSQHSRFWLISRCSGFQKCGARIWKSTHSAFVDARLGKFHCFRELSNVVFRSSGMLWLAVDAGTLIASSPQCTNVLVSLIVHVVFLLVCFVVIVFLVYVFVLLLVGSTCFFVRVKASFL